MVPFLPAVLLAVFAVWAGTLPGSAGFAGAAAGQALLLGVILAGGRLEADPLRLGRGGRWLLGALLVAAAASAWASPAPRAARVGLTLLPAFLLLPAWAARCWTAGPEPRAALRRGLRAAALAVAGVAAVSLADRFFLGSPRASMPLGHHNLLAAWLAVTAPAALAVARHDPRKGWRLVGVATAAAAAAAVLLSGSLGGAGAFALGVGLSFLPSSLPGLPSRPHRRNPRWTMLAGLGVAAAALSAAGAAFGPRLLSILRGSDLSAAARRVYWQGGWEGILERPLLGWGPGAAPWTLGLHLRPVPGVNPPSEVVGQLHSQPLQLAYELGLPGLALAAAVVGVFLWRRFRETRAGAAQIPEASGGSPAGEARPGLDPSGAAPFGVAPFGVAGVAAGLAAGLTNGWLTVPALPVALALAAGLALVDGEAPADGEIPAAPSSRSRRGRPGLARWGAAAYVLAAGLVLLGPARAHRHYDAAREAEEVGEVIRHLGASRRLDPRFPLYSARLAPYLEGGALEGEAGRAIAREAASGAPGVSVLWLSAGVLSLPGMGLPGMERQEMGLPEGGREPSSGREALRRALATDPLGSPAPAFLALPGLGGEAAPGEPASEEAASCAARALLAEPRLGALFLPGDPGLAEGARRALLAWDGVDPGWREAVAAALPAVAEVDPDAAPRSELRLGSETFAEGLSLHAFHRRPWPVPWLAFRVPSEALERLDFPAAAALPGSSATAFPVLSCAP